jgi:long-chain fatty acid transport protein
MRTGMKTSAFKAYLLTAAAGFSGALALGLPAHASGFGLRETSADALGNAFTGGQAKAYDASTVWSNPAGMALLNNDELDGAVSLIAPKAEFTGSATNAQTGGNVSGSQGGNAVAPAASGATFGVLTLGPDWRLGFSITAPFGERTSYPEDFVGRYQSLSSSITDINFGLALSYKINNHLSIGGGPDFDYFQARLTEAVNVPVLSTLTGQDPVGEVRGTSLGVGYTLGALYQFDDATRVGIDYRSRIRHNITGGQFISIPSIYSSISPPIVGLLNGVNSQATTSITLPDIASIGVYHQITPQWAIMGTLEWTDWSLLQHINITPTNGSGGTVLEENWHNTWFVGAGTNYQLTDKIMLQAGFAFDESPVTDENRTTRIPDVNHYDFGWGVQYQVLPSTKLELAYGHVFTPGGSINSTSPSSPLTPAGTITGSYSDSDNSVTAGVNMIF